MSEKEVLEDFVKLSKIIEERDKEIEKLYKIIDSQKRHIVNAEKYFIGRGTKRTGNVILDFELLIRKQVCDEIREKLTSSKDLFTEGQIEIIKDILKIVEQEKGDI